MLYYSKSFYVIQTPFWRRWITTLRLPRSIVRSTESRLRSRCRVSLEAREFGGMTNRDGKRVGKSGGKKAVTVREESGGRVKSDLTNQREAASISTTHRRRFFSYPRAVSPFFTSPTCFFTARSHRANKMEAGQRVSRIKENSTGILSLRFTVSFPSFVVFDGSVGSADRRFSEPKARSMERTLTGSNAELGSL